MNYIDSIRITPQDAEKLRSSGFTFEHGRPSSYVISIGGRKKLPSFAEGTAKERADMAVKYYKQGYSRSSCLIACGFSSNQTQILDEIATGKKGKIFEAVKAGRYGQSCFLMKAFWGIEDEPNKRREEERIKSVERKDAIVRDLKSWLEDRKITRAHFSVWLGHDAKHISTFLSRQDGMSQDRVDKMRADMARYDKQSKETR